MSGRDRWSALRLRGVLDACDSTKVEDQVRFLAEIVKAGVAQLAAHRTRNAARVSSTLTAGSSDAGAGRPGDRLQPGSKQVRLLPASLQSDPV